MGKQKNKGKANIFKRYQKFNAGDILSDSVDILFRYNIKKLCYDYISSSNFELTGYTVDEFMTSKPEWLIEQYHPDDKTAFGELFLSCQNNTFEEDKITRQYRFRHKAGHYIWIDEHARIIRNTKGVVIAVSGCARDITEHKILHQKLKAIADNYKNLYHNSQVPLYRTRISDGKIRLSP